MSVLLIIVVLIGIVGILIAITITKRVMVKRSQKQLDKIAYTGFNVIVEINDMKTIRLYLVRLIETGILSVYTLNSLYEEYARIKKEIKLKPINK
jgi:hypothetical protein